LIPAFIPVIQRVARPRVEAAPKLDDYASGTGPGVAVSDFRQREPGDLTPAGEKTTAFLSYDATSLYVAFESKAQDPSSVRARMSRRESIFDDDFVAVHLDPFQERQRAYMFFSNPLGIQADGVTSEGAGDDMSFDTVPPACHRSWRISPTPRPGRRSVRCRGSCSTRPTSTAG